MKHIILSLVLLFSLSINAQDKKIEKKHEISLSRTKLELVPSLTGMVFFVFGAFGVADGSPVGLLSLVGGAATFGEGVTEARDERQKYEKLTKNLQKVKALTRTSLKLGKVVNEKSYQEIFKNFDFNATDEMEKVTELSELLKALKSKAEKEVSELESKGRFLDEKKVEIDLNSQELYNEMIELLGGNASEYNLQFAFKTYILELSMAYKAKHYTKSKK